MPEQKQIKRSVCPRSGKVSERTSVLREGLEKNGIPVFSYFSFVSFLYPLTPLNSLKKRLSSIASYFC